MELANFTSLAALLVTLTAFLLLITLDWRASIGLLAMQYLGVFILVAIGWPVAMAVTRLVAGWMAGAVLSMAVVSIPARQADHNPEGISKPEDLLDTDLVAPSLAMSRLFIGLTAVMVVLVVASLVNLLMSWLPEIDINAAWASLILIGLGLLKLGFNVRPFPVILGILTVLSGFEIIFSSLETTPLTAGLLAMMTLGLSLCGAYLLLASHMQETE